MTTEQIIANPELLRRMTQQATEVLSYEEQVKRLKFLRATRARPVQPYTPTKEIPF